MPGSVITSSPAETDALSHAKNSLSSACLSRKRHGCLVLHAQWHKKAQKVRKACARAGSEEGGKACVENGLRRRKGNWGEGYGMCYMLLAE